MEKKDYFSGQASAYATFRPIYPDELYAFIFKHLDKKECAWDCGTGNGQVARHLAAHFDTVLATDISQDQLNHAIQKNNIFYSILTAERTTFADNQFDLITVAQALHWFDITEFYNEVVRTGRPGGLLAVWGYALVTINPAIDEILLDFYKNKTGPHWDPARELVENQYRDVPFPFEKIDCPDFHIQAEWTMDQFAGYLTSWSATQKYIRVHQNDPVVELKEALKPLWKNGEIKSATFPVFMKLGRIRKESGA